MSLFVLDTDLLSLWEHQHPRVSAEVTSRLSDLAITVITVHEQLTGWQLLLKRANRPDRMARAYSRLAETVQLLARLPILPFDVKAIELYEKLSKLKLNIGKMDLRIAAITLTHGGILVTRNKSDFSRIPDLQIEDWAS